MLKSCSNTKSTNLNILQEARREREEKGADKVSFYNFTKEQSTLCK